MNYDSCLGYACWFTCIVQNIKQKLVTLFKRCIGRTVYSSISNGKDINFTTCILLCNNNLKVSLLKDLFLRGQ